MALPGGANRIDDTVSTVVLSLPAGASTPRANRLGEWPVPNQLGTPSVHRCGSLSACASLHADRCSPHLRALPDLLPWDAGR